MIREEAVALALVTAILIVVLATCTRARAADCQAKMGPPELGFWRWRIVDGKMCWYVGNRTLDKSNLHWRRPETLQDDGVSGTVLERKFYSPEEMTFEKRWRGEQK